MELIRLGCDSNDSRSLEKLLLSLTVKLKELVALSLSSEIGNAMTMAVYGIKTS